jgi:pimeloyl-ACP methyl ester carboxylesterase
LVDLRNHGHSPWSDEFSYDLMAEDLKELFDKLNLNKVILLGHSMGGKTAMTFASKYEGLLEKLIVVDIGIKQYPMHHNEILEGIKAIKLSPTLTRNEAEENMAQFIDSFGVRQFLLKNLYWNDKKELSWRMNVTSLEVNMAEILAPIMQDKECLLPCLFIRGEKSNYILDEDWDEIENHFSDGKLISIENAGHWVHAEAPKEFLEAVLSFCLS